MASAGTGPKRGGGLEPALAGLSMTAQENAVVAAIEGGATTTAALEQELGVEATRTGLALLQKRGRVAAGGGGWRVLPEGSSSR